MDIHLLMGFLNMEPVDITSVLTRNIIHYLNFCEKPKPYNPGSVDASAHYVPDMTW